MRHRLEYGAVLVVWGLVRLLPRPAALSLGAALGALFYCLDRSRRELGLANLRAAFPSRSDSECRAILREEFQHIGRHVVELLNFHVMSTHEMTRLIEVQGGEHVEQAIAAGKGMVFFSGHFGYWELQVMVHAILYEPLLIIVRTLDNPFLERLLERIRTRVGTRLVPRQGAIRPLLRGLLNKSPVALMIDQHMHDRSAVTVDFFNRPAATTSAVAMVALRAGAPVIPVFALPLPGGRYRLAYEPPVEPPADDDPDPILTYTQRCTDVLEMYVRRYPELWLWMHRRWREPQHDYRDEAPRGAEGPDSSTDDARADTATRKDTLR